MSIFSKPIKRVRVCAEFGVNHLGSLDVAKEAIVKAAQAGADCIKFQTYKAEKLVTRTAPKFWDWAGDSDKKTQFEAYDALDDFPLENYPELIKTCEENHIEFLSTPFDFESADYLNSLGMKAIKVSSSDLTYLPYLKHIAKYHKPILLSTGAATIGEIDEAVNTIRSVNNNKIVLLHCTLKYPTQNRDANLNLIKTLKRMYPEFEVGLSDHTLGTFTAGIAVALGARVIEKHYTLDKTWEKSADHWLSVNPEELKQLVDNVRLTETLMGSSRKRVFKCEKETYLYDKRSIVAAVDIESGTQITKDMLICKRPGTGFPPKFMDMIIGRTAKRKIRADKIITWRLI